jgi:hypothetical protein
MPRHRPPATLVPPCPQRRRRTAALGADDDTYGRGSSSGVANGTAGGRRGVLADMLAGPGTRAHAGAIGPPCAAFSPAAAMPQYLLGRSLAPSPTAVAGRPLSVSCCCCCCCGCCCIGRR